MLHRVVGRRSPFRTFRGFRVSGLGLKCECLPQFENNYFTDMCSGSETGSYLRLIDFVYPSTLGLRVIKQKKKRFTFSHFSRDASIASMRSKRPSRLHACERARFQGRDPLKIHKTL